MAHTGQPAGRNANVPQAAHHRYGGLTPLAPHETLVGDWAAVAGSLAALRSDPSPLTSRDAHAAHTFRPLPERLRQWGAAGIDTAPVFSGLRRIRRRYATLGLEQLLPLDRVLVGAESERPGAFGGFHHEDQGYRHVQMYAVITMYGPMGRDVPADPGLALLDVLRAYAHDCLHYGSARRYTLVDGQVVRTQYGINWRRTDGRTYSAADPQDSPHTRNLGTVMEGACDREARRITRRIAARYGITGPDSPEDPGWWAYRDVTGTLGDVAPGEQSAGEAGRYVASLVRYERGVNRRYASWLDEFSVGEPEALHDRVLASVLSGKPSGLCRWLDARHGPGTFAAIFQAGGYLTAPRQDEYRGLRR
ncbi:hypothetical protein [Streptomyces sp. NPDC087437]|uniref:hypothetical protein n=1 Tax=Streptomyces sp. NPDC087437 TaxID=3365789 RepID=UPI0037F5F1AA